MRDLAIHTDGYAHLSTKVSKLEDLVKLYKGIQMVILEFNSTAGVLVICAKLSTLMLVMVGTYGAVRMEGALRFSLVVVAACAEGYLIILLLLCGTVHNRAMIFLRAMRQQCGRLGTKHSVNFKTVLWLRKNLKHAREVHIKVGSAYFIDKTIVLTTFKINLDNTCSTSGIDHIWDNTPVSRVHRQCDFFDLALFTVDDAKVNKRGGLRRPFQRLVHESPDGFIERWNDIPFDGRPAPRDDPLDGYIFFVEKVFELLGLIYRVKDEKFKLAVKRILRRAKDLVGRQDNELFRHADRPVNDPKVHENHKEILEVFNRAIRTLERTVAYY